MRTRNTARRRRMMRRALIAGATTFLLFAGAGASYAAWTAGASATSAAGAASLAITTTGFDSNAFTFQNHRLTTTGTVTVQNTTDTTSTTPGDLEVSFGYTGSAVLASKLTVSVWPTADQAGCAVVTPPPGTATGGWDTAATSASPLTGTLAAGATQGYCVRVTAAERGELADPTGALTIEPSITATLKVGNWFQSATSTTTQTTAWIFPAYAPPPNSWYQIRNLGSDNCVDVDTASGTSGAGVIDYPCTTGSTSADYHQHWTFTQSSGDYYDLTPRHAQTLRMDVAGGSTAPLAAIDVQTDAAPRPSQEWQLQQRAAGAYQIVNRQSGLCLQVDDSAAGNPGVAYVQAVCDGTLPGQGYTLTQVGIDLPTVTMACQEVGSSVDRTVYFTFSSTPPAYRLQVNTSGATWQDMNGATYYTGTSAAISGNPPFDLANGSHAVRAITSADVVVATSSLRVRTGGSAGPYHYLVCR